MKLAFRVFHKGTCHSVLLLCVEMHVSNFAKTKIIFIYMHLSY